MQCPPAGPSRGISLDWIRTVRLVEAVRQIAGFGFLIFQGSEFPVKGGGPRKNCREVSPNTGPLGLNLDLEYATGAKATKTGTGATLTDKKLFSYLTLGISDSESLGHIHIAAKLPGLWWFLCAPLVGQKLDLRSGKRPPPWCGYLSERKGVIHGMWTLAWPSVLKNNVPPTSSV